MKLETRKVLMAMADAETIQLLCEEMSDGQLRRMLRNKRPEVYLAAQKELIWRHGSHPTKRRTNHG